MYRGKQFVLFVCCLIEMCIVLVHASLAVRERRAAEKAAKEARRRREWSATTPPASPRFPAPLDVSNASIALCLRSGACCEELSPQASAWQSYTPTFVQDSIFDGSSIASEALLAPALVMYRWSVWLGVVASVVCGEPPESPPPPPPAMHSSFSGGAPPPSPPPDVPLGRVAVQVRCNLSAGFCS